MKHETGSFRAAWQAYDSMSPPEEGMESRYAEHLSGLSTDSFLSLNDTESAVWIAEYDERVRLGEIDETEGCH